MKSIFYKQLSIKGDDDNILFWGCTHFNHNTYHWSNPLCIQRGYKSHQEHDEALIRNWNAKSNKDTVGFLLGDVAFGSGGRDAEEMVSSVFEQLNYRHLYVLPGNHTAGWRQLFEKSNDGVIQFGDKTVFFCPNYIEAKINGKSVAMSHYPILSWNGQGGGSYFLHAHVHGNLKLSEVGRAYLEAKSRSLEVSVEIWPSPPSFKEIRAILKERDKVSFDGHNENTKNPF